MPNEPSGAALLRLAETTLVRDVLPGTDGRQRYALLMVANALRIVAREIEMGSSIEVAPPTRELTHAIRAGDHDADGALFSRLLADTVHASTVWKPQTTSADDLSSAGVARVSQA